jgi:hypothetical protein
MDAMDMHDTDEMSNQVLAAFRAIPPMLDKMLTLEPNSAAPKRPRRGEPAKAQPGHSKHQLKDTVNLAHAVPLMAKLAIRLDRDLQQLKKEDTFIFFFGHNGPNNSGAGYGRRGPELPVTIPESPRDSVEAAPPASPLQHPAAAGGDAGWLGDTAGSHQQHDSFARQDVPLSGMGPIPETVEDQSQKTSDDEAPSSTLHGHAGTLGRCAPGIQLPCPSLVEQGGDSMETPSEPASRADQPWQILQTLADSGIWLLMGTSMKPHSLRQSPLAYDLQQALGMSKPPKGKGTGKLKKEPKQE